MIVELSRTVSAMNKDEFLDEDALLPDEVLDKLAGELPEGCMYCDVRNGEDLFFGEME
jgi:hypothetical protein